MEPKTKTCGPYPGGLLTPTHISPQPSRRRRRRAAQRGQALSHRLLRRGDLGGAPVGQAAQGPVAHHHLQGTAIGAGRAERWLPADSLVCFLLKKRSFRHVRNFEFFCLGRYPPVHGSFRFIGIFSLKVASCPLTWQQEGALERKIIFRDPETSGSMFVDGRVPSLGLNGKPSGFTQFLGPLN